MSELSALAGSEGYEVCPDEVADFEIFVNCAKTVETLPEKW